MVNEGVTAKKSFSVILNILPGAEDPDGRIGILINTVITAEKM